MIVLLLCLGVFVNIGMMGPVSASAVYVKNASDYTSGTLSLSEQIQAILDKASVGDTIVFLGKSYENLKLVVTKKLNLVSYVATELSGNSSKSPLILINGPKSSRTTISGFNMANTGSGVLVSRADNVTLTNNNITAINGSAVTVDRSCGTNLKNNNIKGSATGITVSNSKNTSITKNKVINNTNGIIISNSVNTTLKSENISDNIKNGVGIYNSVNTTLNTSIINNNGNNGVEIHRSNRTIVNNSTIKRNKVTGVYLESSDKFKISNSDISENHDGVSTKDVTNATITNNNITKNYMHGILLSGYAKTFLITGNTLTKNGNGIRVDSSIIKNVIINGNTLTGNIKRTDTTEETGHGLSFGSNYIPSITLKIEHNIITCNQHRDIDSHDSNYESYIGSNFYGSHVWICGCVTTESGLALIRTGENTYAAYFIDGDTGEIESDFPPTSVTFTTSSGYSITVKTINGVAYITASGGNINDILTALSYGVSQSISLYSEFFQLPAFSKSSYTDWTADDNNLPANGTDPNKDPNSGSGKNPNPSTNGTGGNPGGNSNNNPNNNPSNGAVYGPASSVGLITAAAAGRSASPAGQTGSNGQQSSQTKDSKTTQELFIDNTVKNPQVWGIIGIIVLLILVFGTYYRNDPMNMIKKSKK